MSPEKAPTKQHPVAPEHTAVRVALWRALHVQLDPPPHVLVDEVGLRLVDEPGWRARPDMNPQFSLPMRASIVGRARFVEDLVEARAAQGVEQYVLLGAGLDTFAQRRPELAARLRIFEVDQPGPQAWKRRRLAETGLPVPAGLRFVPVDFEAGESWWDALLSAGFDVSRPAVVVSTGVSMYLSREANFATLQRLSTLAPGSEFALTFMLAAELLEPAERATLEFVMKRAAEAGTPFLSLFAPPDLLALARQAGFADARYVAAEELHQRYFAHRTDGLRTGQAEAFLVATT
jgi:methyltransferase (TIGR00027 family)